MKKHSILTEGIVALLFLFGAARAATWYVHPDSTLNSIQAGIDLCSTGDTVLVGAGTYIENINFNSMAIAVMSEHGPDTTIIDGSNPSNPDTGSVACFVTGEDTTSVLYGFTITGGTGTVDPLWGPSGGGIICSDASPTITGNIISANRAAYGGGIGCYYSSSPIITANTIRGNVADTASGGIECYMLSSPHIAGNTIDSNTSNSGGGGIQVYDQCSPNIINNAVVGNIAGTWGGGIRVGQNSSPIIRDNHIEGNQAFDGGGILCDGGINTSPLIVHNTITDNTATNVGGGIECDYYATPTIDSCMISYNIGDEIYCYNGGNPVIYYNDIIDSVNYAVFNADPSVTLDADSNWWGHSSGPYHPTANPSGQGLAVSDYVDFDPWLTQPGVEELEPSQSVVIVLQVSPNPFRNKVSIKFSMEHSAEVIELKIYNATGRMVKEFNRLSNNQIFWNGTDNCNRRLSSGVYFLKLTAGEHSTTEKLLLIR
jgi:hypothetical protein